MKRSEKAVAGSLVLGLALGSLYFGALNISAKRRDAALAKIHLPAATGNEAELDSRDSDAGAAAFAPARDRASARAVPRSPMEAFADIFQRTAFIDNDAEWGGLIDSVNGRTHAIEIQQPIEPPADAMPKLRKLIEGIQPLLDEIRRTAAGGGPVTALELSQGLSVDTSHIRPVRNLARLLRADALVAREHGETQRIIDDIVAIMRLSDALACDPIRYSQLVRMAIASIASDVLRMLPEGPLEAEHYEQLRGVFRDAYHREEFAASYGGEATMLAALFERPPDPAFWAGSADNVFQAGTFHVLSSPLGRPVRNIDESNALDALAAVRELALLPFWEAQPALTQIETALDGRPWWSYSRSLLPGYMNLTRNFRAQADHEERMNLALLGLAIEMAHARTGDLPESLREIEDQFPEGIPLCPVTGTPYVYSPGTEWFQLYGQLTYPRGAEVHALIAR